MSVLILKKIEPLIRELRPRQWTKNLVVLTAFFFALGDRHQALSLQKLTHILLATAIFSMICSGVYIINDLLDLAADREHPTKRKRPIAAGEISPATGRILAMLLLLGGTLGALALNKAFALIIVAYIIIQALYSGWLKRLPLVDVFVISTGFVLRAIAGGVAIDVAISPWLLICTFLMALFLALCKRRHEIRLKTENIEAVRISLIKSNELLLNQLIAITAASVIIAYAVYTQWPETVDKFGTHQLGLTLPFVVFGVFRYLDLVYRHAKGEQPESILLTDTPLLMNIALYGLVVLLILVPKTSMITTWAQQLGIF